LALQRCFGTTFTHTFSINRAGGIFTCTNHRLGRWRLKIDVKLEVELEPDLVEGAGANANPDGNGGDNDNNAAENLSDVD
jgi:hypothetical protein